MSSPAAVYRSAWSPEMRQRLSNELQGYGNCLRQYVSKNGDVVTINAAGYKNCGGGIRQTMRQFMRG